MKTVNSAVTSAIRDGYAVEAQPRLTAEWNMNRYYSPTIDNNPSEDTNGFDIDLFPIESTIEPNRPGKGILKARIDQSAVFSYTNQVTSRFYSASDQDVYHYWTSPDVTNSSRQFTTGVMPAVTYSDIVQVNKLVIKVENFWSSPDVFYIKTSGDGINYNTVATSPTIDALGQIILYWNGTAWSSNVPTNFIDPPLYSLKSLMIDVRSMREGRDLANNVSGYQRTNFQNNIWTTSTVPYSNGALVSFNLIEISARRQVDLTPYLINVSDNFEMGESSDLYPIGTLTTNDASVTLSNIYTASDGTIKSGWFNTTNAESPYRGILEPNVLFNLEYIYRVSGQTYPVQQFRMYSDDWTGQKTDEISISMHDESVFLQTLTPPPALYENLTVPEIFQRVLDSVGFTNWVVDANPLNTNFRIPIFYMKGEQNVWEVLDDLAKGTQTAIYFDGFARLRIQTRAAAFDPTKAVAWTLYGQQEASTPANIAELNENAEVGMNDFSITYQATSWDNWNDGSPTMTKVWEPDGDVVLRSSPLIYNMTASDNVFWISPSQVPYWQFDGSVQIDGEIVKYRGKHFVYYTGTDGSVFNQVFAKTADEYQYYNELTPPSYRIKNGFTGAIAVAVDDGVLQRGYLNSQAQKHTVDTQSYTTKRVWFSRGNQTNHNASGLYHDRWNSNIRLDNDPAAQVNDMTYAVIGAPTDSEWRFAGTKVNLIAGGVQEAGMFINGFGDYGGYYLTLKGVPGGGHQGLQLYSYSVNGRYSLGTVPFNAVAGQWYELEISFATQNGHHIISAFVNGRLYITADLAQGAPARNPGNGRFGMCIMGNTAAKFEYLYGVARLEPEMTDDSSFFNLVYGGYTGSQWQREWVHGWKTRKVRKKKKTTKETSRWNQYFFDEFGPYVHEVREFDVSFDPSPAQISRLYMSNSWDAICTQYYSSPFDAHFTLTNTSRQHAIVNGDDNLTYVNNTISQVLTVLGRVLIMADAETIEVTNDRSVRIRGKLSAELDSLWIQSKGMAQEIANWMNTHWGSGLDTVDATIFGNPLLEIGDVVAIKYDKKGMTATSHKYFVVGVENEFDAGIKTTLHLRRVAS